MINTMQDISQKREKAQKKVNQIKGFYGHLRAYIIVNVLLILAQTKLVDFILAKNENLDPSFFHWVDINILFTLLFWGLGLAIHGFYVFSYKFAFLKAWEERQIKKFMEEDDANRNQFN